jgi:hypothetical protein
MAKNVAFQTLLVELKDELAQAAERWLVMEDVASDFARNVVQPAYELLLPTGVEWLYVASEAADPDDFWRDGNLEEPIIAVLRRCWETQQSAVVSQPSVRGAFLGLLTTLASRGSHAAIHLRDRVLDSMPAG